VCHSIAYSHNKRGTEAKSEQTVIVIQLSSSDGRYI